MKKNILLAIISIATLSNYSCQKESNKLKEPSINGSEKLATVSNVLSDTTFVTNPKNLNIIYFIPNDNPARPNYKKRISDFLIHFQHYVTSEMTRNGFSGKTLGLPLDPTTNGVKIITIQGNYGYEYYDYDNGSSRIMNEINTYKNANPSEFSSNNHNFIILPERPDKGSQPFYGVGRNAYALDFKDLELTYLSTTSSSYIGGFFHELGHGLNLPHNRQKKGEATTLGTALMGSGNSTYGKSPTFLTFADCAIFYYNEIFQPTNISNQYAANTTSVNITNASYNSSNQSISLTGNFTSTLPITQIFAYLDPITASNTDHDSPSWGQHNTSNTFNFTIPLSDLYTTGNSDYTINLRLLANNGTINTTSYYFSFVNGTPIFRKNELSVHQHCSYGGYAVNLPYGVYNSTDLISLGISNNDISSIKIPIFGIRAKAFDADNFTGGNIILTNSSNCLTSHNYNDKISSLIVEPYGGNGKIKIYKHASYGGTMVELGVGLYRTTDLVGLGMLDNDVSSIQVPSNMKVTLFDNDNIKGASYVVTNNINYLSAFNDKTSSILVEQLD